MKTKFLIITVLFCYMFTGCKNEKTSQKTSDSPQEQISDEGFKVYLDVLVNKDDNFQLYYIETNDEPFTEEKSIWIEVKGKDASQKLTFTLPKDVVPALIRLDFGVSDKQQDIKLLDFEMDYFGKTFKSKGSMMANYFRPLEGTNIDFSTGTIKANMKNGKRVEPVLYPHEIPLGDEISKIVK